MSKPVKKVDIKELEKKIAGLTEALQRERADAVNLRRRVEEVRAPLERPDSGEAASLHDARARSGALQADVRRTSERRRPREGRMAPCWPGD